MAPEISPGSITQEFPAWHQFQQFYDVAAIQFIGTLEQVKESRRQFDHIYPTQEKCTLGMDATWLCQLNGFEIYSLTVLVKGIL